MLYSTEPGRHYPYKVKYHIYCTLTNMLCATTSVMGMTIAAFPVVWPSDAHMSQRETLQILHLLSFVNYAKDIVFDDRYYRDTHQKKRTFSGSLALCAIAVASSELHLALCTFAVLMALAYHTDAPSPPVVCMFTAQMCIGLAFIRQASPDVELLNILWIAGTAIIILERLTMPNHARILDALSLLVFTILLADAARIRHAHALAELQTASRQIVVPRESFRTVASRLLHVWTEDLQVT